MAKETHNGRRPESPLAHSEIAQRLMLAHHDPLAAPSWRWDLARQWADQHCRIGSCPDPVVRVAWRYLRARYSAVGQRHMAAVAQRYPDLTAAHHIHGEAGMARAELESRLLANQSVENIAAKLALPTGVVRTYESAFFAVLERLNAHDWIVLHAVRIGPWGSPNPSEGDIWRYLAWQCPAAMECVIADLKAPAAARDPAKHLMAERLRRLVRFTCTPNGHPMFSKLIREMIVDTTDRALDSPSLALADELANLEILQALTRRRRNTRRAPKVPAGPRTSAHDNLKAADALEALTGR